MSPQPDLICRGTRAKPNPGKSTKRNRSFIEKKFNDWVLPGVDEVRANPLTRRRELIKLDLPTFDLPMKAISGFESEGQSFSVKALFKNSACVTFMSIRQGLWAGRNFRFKISDLRLIR